MWPGREPWKWILAPLFFSASFSAPGILTRPRFVPDIQFRTNTQTSITAHPNGTSYTSVEEIQHSSSKIEIRWKAEKRIVGVDFSLKPAGTRRGQFFLPGMHRGKRDTKRFPPAIFREKIASRHRLDAAMPGSLRPSFSFPWRKELLFVRRRTFKIIECFREISPSRGTRSLSQPPGRNRSRLLL